MHAENQRLERAEIRDPIDPPQPFVDVTESELNVSSKEEFDKEVPDTEAIDENPEVELAEYDEDEVEEEKSLTSVLTEGVLNVGLGAFGAYYMFSSGQVLLGSIMAGAATFIAAGTAFAAYMKLTGETEGEG